MGLLLCELTAVYMDVGGGAAAGEAIKQSPSMPTTPTTPVTPSSSTPPRGGSVWRSVFHPGSNLATKSLGANLFDRPQPNSPTVYDWYVR